MSDEALARCDGGTIRRKMKEIVSLRRIRSASLILTFALVASKCSGFYCAFGGAVERRLRGPAQHPVVVLESNGQTPEDDTTVGAIPELEGPFDASQLGSYWGRRPVLIRAAFDPNSKNNEACWPTWDKIVSLACYSDEDGDEEEWNDDNDVETGESARLITHTPGQLHSFDVELGPFAREELDELIALSKDQDPNKEKWTVLVNDVDRYVPTLSQWMDETFAFLPRWRRDDAQISIAAAGGGIGPHVDNYDVFLIQAAGQRQWIVAAANDYKLTAAEEAGLLISDIPVSILQLPEKKKNDQDGLSSLTELTLQTGDMLYLPPRVVHWGTATTDDCMTLSVGCRAPSAAELVARVAETVQQSVRAAAVQRYTDDHLLQENHDGNSNSSREPSLSQPIKESMKDLVRNTVEDLLEDDQTWDSLVGKITTEPIRYAENMVRHIDREDKDYRKTWGETAKELLQNVMKRGDCALLLRSPGVSIATSRVKTENGQLVDRIFAGGELWEAEHDKTVAKIFHLIERGEPIDGDMLSAQQTKGVLLVLEDLVREGVLRAMLKV